MFDAVLNELVQIKRYLESYVAHYPERTFLILGGALLVLVWLMRGSRRVR